jgi:arylsulfatase A-like enzyme
MAPRLRQAFLEIVFAVYALCFAEWLFQVTKPSFMSVLTLGESLEVLLISPLYHLVPLLLLQAGVELVWHFAPGGLGERWVWPSAVVPAAVHSVTALLLVDNFTYSLFGVGVVSLSGNVRYAFTGLWLAVFCAVIAWRSRTIRSGRRAPRSVLLRYRGAQVLVTSALVLSAFHVLATRSATAVTVETTPRGGALPDILFISLDGTEAAHTSLYGYERRTTPFIDRLTDSSLVVENAFSNNCYTAASLLALLSGQRPTDFRVFYPPMMLQGAHAYHHLPAILRKLGYRTSQYAARYFASGLWQGMRHAFDYENGKDVRTEELWLLPAAAAERFPSQRHFLIQTRTRVMERAQHLFGVEDMPQYMDVVRNLAPDWALTDAERAAGVIEFLGRGRQPPAFVQVHFMKGHCCFYYFPPEQQEFSRPREGHVVTQIDGYDDAIRAMDANVGEIVAWLEAEHRLDNTLLVITADHTMNWGTNDRVPLLIRFPNGEHRGRLSANAQLADVAPTVLDYLGVPRPAWMTGASLLRAETLDRLRPIISASRVEKAAFRMPKPPLYGLQSVSAVVCDRAHELTLDTGELTTRRIAGHTAPCSPGEEPTPEAVQTLLVEHLTERGFALPSW